MVVKDVEEKKNMMNSEQQKNWHNCINTLKPKIAFHVLK